MSEENPKENGVVALCFLFIALVLGSIITYIQTWYLTPNWVKSIPFTVIVFTIGFIIGLLTTSASDNSNSFVESIKLWDNMNPEMVLYIFIPALIFGEVTNLNMHHLKSTAIQGVLLAGPGALAGAFIMGALLVHLNLFPYAIHWNANSIYLFASILCATDAVSVVALLSKMELFRSQKLKYIITNESLLNDATALVLYTIFLSGEMLDDTPMTGKEIFIYFLKVLFVSPLLGVCFGLASLMLMVQVSHDKFSEEHTIIKIIVPICAAYLSFFVGNFVLEESGILSVYCAGLMFCWLAPSFFRHNESVHSVWLALEWMANTLIFILAGMMIGYRSLDFFTWRDLSNIVVAYVILYIVRGLVVLLLYPLLSWFGKGCTVPEAVFIVFSGLRGAVSVSLALSFGLACEAGLTRTSAKEGNRLFFYTGGVTALSLLINGTFAESVLQMLGLSENTGMSSSIEIMRNYTRKRLIEASIKRWLEIPLAHRDIIVERCKLFEELDEAWKQQQIVDSVRIGGGGGGHDNENSNKFFTNTARSVLIENDADKTEMDQHATILAESANFRNHPRNKYAACDNDLMESVRSAFLECVRAYYWMQVHKGIFKRYSYVARTLVASVDLGLETVATKELNDWNYIAQIIQKNSGLFDMSVVRTTYSFLQKKVPRVAKYQQRQVENISNILTTFIAAHKHAQIKIPQYFGDIPGVIDTIEQAEVVNESQQLVEMASSHLRDLRDPLLQYRKTKEKALQILSKLEAMLAQCKEEAVIMNSDLHHFLDSITEERTAINKLFSQKSARLKPKSKTLDDYRLSFNRSDSSDDSNSGSGGYHYMNDSFRHHHHHHDNDDDDDIVAAAAGTTRSRSNSNRSTRSRSGTGLFITGTLNSSRESLRSSRDRYLSHPLFQPLKQPLL